VIGLVSLGTRASKKSQRLGVGSRKSGLKTLGSSCVIGPKRCLKLGSNMFLDSLGLGSLLKQAWVNKKLFKKY
jgi:hypothetical protein